MTRFPLSVALLYKKVGSLQSSVLSLILRSSLFIVFGFVTLVGSGQTDSVQTDSSKQRKIFISPVIGYSPETRLWFGAGGIFYLPPSKKYPETTPTVIKTIFVYSLNKQIESNVEGDAYFKNNLYKGSFMVSFYKFPANFFGIGNYNLYEDRERYGFDFFNIGLNGQKKVADNFYAGVKTFFETTSVYDFEPGGIFDTQNIPGEEGGLNTGIGAWFTYDTRDNIYFPYSGIYVDISSVFHNSFLGSDFNYFEQVIEISQFNKVLNDDALAFNFYSVFLPGDPPFNRMAKLGGDSHMRGNYEGRFRDQFYMTVQSEYRITLWKYFGINIFAGIGEVAGNFSEFSLKGLKYSIGAGGRLFIVPEDKLSLRLDIAMGSKTNEPQIFGIRNEVGLYVTFREAF